MAEHDIKTRLEIEARAKGFEDASRKAKALAGEMDEKKLTKGFARLEKNLEGSSVKLRELHTGIKHIVSGIERFSKAVDQSERLAKSLGNTKTQAKAVGEELERIQKRGGFAQGVMQGVGFGQFVQRGPGMQQQALGMLAGQLGRGFARAPFTGLAGVTQGIANIPGVGVAAGAFQSAIQGASEFLDVRRMQMELLRGSRLLGPGATLPEDRASAAAMSRAAGRPDVQAMRRAGAQAGAKAPRDITAYGAEVWKRGLPNAKEGWGGLLKDLMAPAIDEIVPSLAAGAANTIIAKAGKQAAAKAKQAGLSVTPAMIGAPFGMAIPDVMQRQLSMMQIGGTKPGAGLLRAGLAAEAGFGVGPEVAGAMLAARRTGGLGRTGGRQSADLLADSIQSAFRAGLQGLEIPRYLSSMAAGIQEFQQTGIPFARDSISEMTRMLAIGGGIMPGRGINMASALARRGQQMALAGGPQSGLDFLMLQQLGGYRGGGIGGLNQALETMRSGNFGGQVPEFLRRAIGVPITGTAQQKDAARYQLRGVFAQLTGQAIGLQEQESLRSYLAGEGGGSARGRRRAGGESIGPSSGQELVDTITRVFRSRAPELESEASVRNQRIIEGGKMVGSMIDLEKAQTNMIKGITAFDTEIKKVTGDMTELTRLVPQLSRALKDMMSGGYSSQ